MPFRGKDPVEELPSAFTHPHNCLRAPKRPDALAQVRRIARIEQPSRFAILDVLGECAVPRADDRHAPRIGFGKHHRGALVDPRWHDQRPGISEDLHGPVVRLGAQERHGVTMASQGGLNTRAGRAVSHDEQLAHVARPCGGQEIEPLLEVDPAEVQEVVPRPTAGCTRGLSTKFGSTSIRSAGRPLATKRSRAKCESAMNLVDVSRPCAAPPVKRDRGSDRRAHRQRTRGSSGAQAPGQRTAPDAVLAWPAVSKQLRVDAQRAEVVKSRDHREPARGARGDGRRADERKGVVDVDDVGTGLVEESAQPGLVLPRPDDAGRKRGLLRRREAGDLVAGAGVAEHLTAGVAHELRLELDGGVLAARRGGAVVVVHERDAQARDPVIDRGPVGRATRVSRTAPMAQQLPAEQCDELAVRPRVAAAQPARLGREPVQPFETQPLHRLRRAPLGAGQEVEGRAHAERERRGQGAARSAASTAPASAFPGRTRRHADRPARWPRRCAQSRERRSSRTVATSCRRWSRQGTGRAASDSSPSSTGAVAAVEVVAKPVRLAELEHTRHEIRPRDPRRAVGARRGAAARRPLRRPGTRPMRRRVRDAVLGRAPRTRASGRWRGTRIRPPPTAPARRPPRPRCRDRPAKQSTPRAGARSEARQGFLRPGAARAAARRADAPP